MNVRCLIELLSTFPEDAEIQLATQEGYPLRYDLHGVYFTPKGYEHGEGGEDAGYHPTETTDVVWLVEGSQDSQNPYGVPEDAWAEAMNEDTGW